MPEKVPVKGRPARIFRGPPRRAGVTLIEMIIVVALLVILSMLAVSKISSAIQTANDGATKENLSSIRAALAAYYIDHEGAYPDSIEPLMRPGNKYLSGVVPIYTAAHGTNHAFTYSSQVDDAADDGTWGYVNTGSRQGTVWIRCTHDMDGKPWSAF